MRYLSRAGAEQDSKEDGGWCDVFVWWDFSVDSPDAIEIRYLAVGGSSDRVTVVPIKDRKPTEVTVRLPAPQPIFFLGVFPQLSDGAGGFKGSFPDEYGVERVWEEHGIVLQASTVADPDVGNTASGKLAAPQMLQPHFGPGTLTLRWTWPHDTDFFRLEYVRSSKGSLPYRSRPSVAHATLWRTRPREGVHGSVWAGSEKVIGQDNWSEDAAAFRTTVPEEFAYKPLEIGEIQGIDVARRGPDWTALIAGDRVAWSLTHSHAEGYHVPHRISGIGLDHLQPVALISRSPNFMDAFSVVDHRVHVAWWKSPVWHDWGPMSDPSFPDQAAVAACTRNSDYMDVFAVDLNGDVQGSWWNGSPWRPWKPLPGATFPPGASVAAGCRNDDVNEVWSIDVNGDVRGNHWNGSWNGWFTLAGPKFPPGSYLARSVTPHSMRLAAVDVDGTPQEIVWRGSWREWQPRPGVSATPGQPLAASGGGALWLVDTSRQLYRWRPATQDWLREHEEGTPFELPLAATDGIVVGFSATETYPGRIQVGTIDPLTPAGPCSWWSDDD